MFQRLVILFFLFFLVSRFFSEVLMILPKWVDLIDIPFILFISFFSFFYLPHPDIDYREHRFFGISVLIILMFVLLSSLMNSNDFFIPAAVLFCIGFLEGPLLFLSLDKLTHDVELLASTIQKLFFFLLLINVIVVLFFNMPAFILTGDPDKIGGTYGLNQYYFSVLLVICGGILLGEGQLQGRRKLVIILGQSAIFVIYFLLQFRAGLPFFLLSYGIVIIVLYGTRIMRFVVIGSAVLMISGSGIFYVLSKTEDTRFLKYDDWVYILKDPLEFLQYGKFKVYAQTAKMMVEEPLTAIAGVGPGNFLSRAYFTFSYEMVGSRKKGVSDILMKYFGVSGPRFTLISEQYLTPTRTGPVLGTYQLSNPNSSFVSPVAEIGLIGGIFVIGLYVHLLRKSIQLLRDSKKIAPELLPLATALTGSATYLFGLAFLDNYWEMSRATLPVWLLFWGVNTSIHLKIKNKITGNFGKDTSLEKNGFKIV